MRRPRTLLVGLALGLAAAVGPAPVAQGATPAESLPVFGCRSDLNQPRPDVPRPLQQAADDCYADIFAA